MYFPVTFRFSDLKTQDLLVTVSRKLGKNPVETIQTVVSDERTADAILAGWGPLALSMWGHGQNKLHDEDFEKLDKPELEVPLSEEQLDNLIVYCSLDGFVESIEELIGVFLIFEAAALGYHV